MATVTREQRFIINEKAADKILSTSPVKLPESKMIADIFLSDEVRAARAKSILDKFKCN